MKIRAPRILLFSAFAVLTGLMGCAQEDAADGDEAEETSSDLGSACKRWTYSVGNLCPRADIEAAKECAKLEARKYCSQKQPRCGQCGQEANEPETFNCRYYENQFTESWEWSCQAKLTVR